MKTDLPLSMQQVGTLRYNMDYAKEEGVTKVGRLGDFLSMCLAISLKLKLYSCVDAAS